MEFFDLSESAQSKKYVFYILGSRYLHVFLIVLLIALANIYFLEYTAVNLMDVDGELL